MNGTDRATRDQTIITLFRKGFALSAIAHRYSLSTESVRMILKQHEAVEDKPHSGDIWSADEDSRRRAFAARAKAGARAALEAK